MALNGLQRMLVYNMRAGTGRQSVTLFDLNWKGVCWATQIFVAHCMSTYGHKSAMTILGLQIHISK